MVEDDASVGRGESDLLESNSRLGRLDGQELGGSTSTPSILSGGAPLTPTNENFGKPSLKLGGRKRSAILRMTSSLTVRSRRLFRSMHTSKGTSKKTACAS